MEFIELYFKICLIIWGIDVIATLVAIYVTPVRRWMIKQTIKWSVNVGLETAQYLEKYLPEEGKED